MKVFSILMSRIFILFFTFKATFFLELIFVCGVRVHFIFFHMDIQSTQYHLFKILYFPYFSAMIAWSQIKCSYTCGFLKLLFYSIGLFFILAQNPLSYFLGFQSRFDIRKKLLSCCLECLGCPWPLCFCTYFRISILISIPKKKPIGIFIGTVWNL